jgi:hypothetical protein
MSHCNVQAISAHGCVVQSPGALPGIGEVRLQCEGRETSAALTVLPRLIRKRQDRTQIGFEPILYLCLFVRPDPAFWGQALPRATPQPIQLSCSGCGFTTTSRLEPAETMTLLVRSSLARLCPCCGTPSEFRQATQRVEASPFKSDPNLVPFGEQIFEMRPQTRTVNERRHKRLATQHSRACIRCAGRDDDMVEVLDISRGGLRFESPRYYEPGTAIEVATHYVEGGNNIFQQARIVRRIRDNGNHWNGEYGVQFVQNG